MTSLYQQSVPSMIKSFRAMSSILSKAVKFADEKGIPHKELLKFRLIADMKPLTYQIQSMSNTAKFLAVRIGGAENVVLTDNETTFEQLQTRITRSIEILSSLDKDSMNGWEEKEVLVTAGGGFKFKIEDGVKYVNEYAVPNFHFHMSTAYCILRHLGVPIDAMDYLKDAFQRA